MSNFLWEILEIIIVEDLEADLGEADLEAGEALIEAGIREEARVKSMMLSAINARKTARFHSSQLGTGLFFVMTALRKMEMPAIILVPLVPIQEEVLRLHHKIIPDN